MVTKYLKSLQDVIEGDVIGSGYHSLVKQLQNRIENAKRSTTPKERKRKLPTESDTDKMPPEKRAAIQDTYGCIKWDMKFMPLGETAESQQQSKEELKSLFKQNAPNQDKVKQLTRSTFYTQRKEINNGKEIKNLLEDWPFLFDENGMAVHFEELTGVSLKETFIRNLDLKWERLLNYLKTVAVNKSKRLVQAFTKIQLMSREHTGTSDYVLEMVFLLLSYFDEKEDMMFAYVEDTCLAGEVQMDQVPLTPTIVVCGKLTMSLSQAYTCQTLSHKHSHIHCPLTFLLLIVFVFVGRSCYSARRWMLSVNQIIVQDNIQSFISALCLMFGSFYCFNIHFPAGLAFTQEFLQRYIFYCYY